MPYNPEIWLESLTRELKAYVEAGVNNAVRDNTNAPVGLTIYDVVMQWPGAIIEAAEVPLSQNVIHFEIDDIAEAPVGMGDNIFDWNFNEADYTVDPQEARVHVVNFDVGIWTSDRTGGTTARLRARQVLSNLLSGALAIQRLRAATDGGNGALEIVRYTGGSFTTERINDVNVYRMMGAELDIRVYSRTPISNVPAPAIEEIGQSPGLTIL